MSSLDIPFQVLYYGSSITNTPVDVSKYVNSVSTTFQGTGRIRVSTLMLDAHDGQFITQSNDGSTPIVSAFDLFWITWTDDNGFIKWGIFSIDQILKQVEVRGKYLLPVELKARERALQDIKVFAYYEFWNPFDVINDLLSRYSNYSRGTLQPDIACFSNDESSDTNFAPQTVNNIYDFSAGVTYYDALMMVIARLNQSTDLGGVGNFYSMTFADNETELGLVTVNIFPQGTDNGEVVDPIPTIQDSDNDPIHSNTVQKNSPLGTQTGILGTPDTGVMPPQLHIYQSYVEMIENLPVYDSSVTYTLGIYITYQGLLYEYINATPSSGNTPNSSPTYWQNITPETIIGELNYSEWTNDKVAVHTNSCSNPETPFLSAEFDSPAYPDGNLVIRDQLDSTTDTYKFFRDFVICRAISDVAITEDSNLKQYLMGGSKNVFYQGFTVLVDTTLGTPSGAFAGKDPYGIVYADCYVQFDGEDWIVMRAPQVGDQCAVLYEGRTYEYNVTVENPNAFGNVATTYGGYGTDLWKVRGPAITAYAWQDVTETVAGNDAFHHPMSIQNVDGFLIQNDNGLDYSSYVEGSALQITYEFNPEEDVYNLGRSIFDKLYQALVQFGQQPTTGQINDVTTPNSDELALMAVSSYYDYGWWWAIPFPLPVSTFNGITEEVGDLYGGGEATAAVFACLDLQNANFTHSGIPGINNEDASDIGAPLTGIQFIFQFDIKILGNEEPFQGNLPFTISIYDDLRDVWRADFSVDFLGVPQQIMVPFSAFTTNRPSRTPINLDTLLSQPLNVISVPKIEIVDIFEQHRVRLITIQFGQSYDQYLRYSPISIDKILSLNSLGLVLPIQFIGTIDAFGFTKQPFVTSGVVSDRVINPDIIQANNVRNYLQLEGAVIAQNQINNFPFEQYTVVRDGSCDLALEQYVYLYDPDFVGEEDDPDNPNTRQLVLMSDQLSYDTNNGFLRTMTLTTRILT